MAEGSTGAPKTSGGQGYESFPSFSALFINACVSIAGKILTNRSDAFQKREKASEDYAIKQREKEKLMELKRKLAEQHEHLKKLEDHM